MLLGIEESTKRKEKQYWPDENSGILHLGNKIDIQHLSSCAHSTFVSRYVGLVKIIKKSLLSISIQNLASFKTRREEEKINTIAD